MARLGITPRTVRARFDELYQLEARIQSEQQELSGPTLHEARTLQSGGQSARSSSQRAFLAAGARLLLLERRFNEESIGARGLSRRRLRAYLTQLDSIHQSLWDAVS